MDDLVAGRYQLVRTLGRGGMGEVVLARQLDLDKLVVVKRADVKSQRNQRALVDEARIAARLNHPNIVSVLEVLERPDQAIVVMEFVAGVTLRELIEDSPEGLPVEVALAIAVDILRGLGYAHAVKRGDAIGVIHRDVKPRNLMVTFAGTSKLIDFGISRWLDDSGGWEATSISGTRGYMAPEQLEGTRVDGRADLYALGVTLREMLTGVPPVDDTGNRDRRRTEIAEPYLVAIVDRATAPLPGDRFPNCGEMISAIETYAAAASIALGVGGVERWVTARFADRMAALDGDADRRRVPRPPTQPTLIDRGAQGSDSAALEPRVRLTSRATGDPSDQLLGPVCERLLREHLLHAPIRRFHVVDAADAQRIELTCARSNAGFTVEARAGASTIASGSGPSVIDAIAVVGNALIDGAARLPELGPDAAELAAMTKLGTRSFDAYRHYRSAVRRYFSSFVQDTSPLIESAEHAISADPGWLHAHALLATLLGISTPDGCAALAAARATGDPARDPNGARLIEFLVTQPLTLDLLGEIFRSNPDDLLAGYHLIPHSISIQQLDDTVAVARKLHASHPELLFGADLAETFSRGGRDDEAARVIREWTARYPENLGAVIELARIESTAGNLADVARLARNANAIHGEQPDKLTLLFELFVLADDLASAQRVADRMMLGTAIERAQGRYRIAAIAVFQGRFAAAHGSARRAIEENRPFGWQSELLQCLALALSIARLLGDAPAARRYATELASTQDNMTLDCAGAARTRYDLAIYETKIAPPIDEQLASLDGSLRDVARVAMMRSAALAGGVSCAEAVAAGLSDNENSASSLLALGICAQREGELAIARRCFEKATRLWSPLLAPEASPYHAMLARYHLAKLLVELGQHDEARLHYEAFLRRWGNADRPIPEVAAARAAL